MIVSYNIARDGCKEYQFYSYRIGIPWCNYVANTYFKPRCSICPFNTGIGAAYKVLIYLDDEP